MLKIKFQETTMVSVLLLVKNKIFQKLDDCSVPLVESNNFRYVSWCIYIISVYVNVAQIILNVL